jgi:nucleotide-binding universal stress UspA family protein
MRRGIQSPHGVCRRGRFVEAVPRPYLRAGNCSHPAPRAILHPTDYSEASRQAFELACRIASDRGSRVIVMHVPEAVDVSSLSIAPLPALPKGYRAAWLSRLRLIQPRDPAVRVEHRLEEGDVAAGILRVASAERSDLIVMAGRERTGLERLLRASVSDAVERKAPCPVLRLHAKRAGSAAWATGDDSRGKDLSKPKAILCPTDFSHSARHAFKVACSLARASGSELVVVHFAPVADLYCTSDSYGEHETKLQKMAASAPTVHARWVLRGGDPATEILSMAEEAWCDLIVMGARRRSGLRRLFGYTVPEKVRWKAPRPVVTVIVPPERPAMVRQQPPPARSRSASDIDSDGGDHDFSAHHPAPDGFLALRR